MKNTKIYYTNRTTSKMTFFETQITDTDIVQLDFEFSVILRALLNDCFVDLMIENTHYHIIKSTKQNDFVVTKYTRVNEITENDFVERIETYTQLVAFIVANELNI